MEAPKSLAQSVLSEELLVKYEGYGTNAADLLVLPSKRKKQRLVAPGRRAAAAEPVVATSRTARRAQKSKDRKLASLQENREQKAKRADLIGKLLQTALKPEEQALLHHSGALGHTMSARETREQGDLERAARRLPADSDGNGGSDIIDSDSGDEEDAFLDAAREASPAVVAPAPIAAPAVAPAAAKAHGTIAPTIATGSERRAATTAAAAAATAAAAPPAPAAPASQGVGKPAMRAAVRWWDGGGGVAKGAPARGGASNDDDEDEGDSDADADDSDDNSDEDEEEEEGDGGGADGNDDNVDDDDDEEERGSDDEDGGPEDPYSTLLQSDGSKRKGARKGAKGSGAGKKAAANSAPAAPSAFSFRVTLPSGRRGGTGGDPLLPPAVASAASTVLPNDGDPHDGAGSPRQVSVLEAHDAPAATAPPVGAARGSASANPTAAAPETHAGAPSAAAPAPAPAPPPLDLVARTALASHSSIHSSDPALQRLLELRQRNLAAAASAPGGSRAPASTWAAAAFLPSAAAAADSGEGSDGSEGEGEEGAHHPATLSGDLASGVSPTALQAERALRLSGFGSAAEVMAAGETYAVQFEALPEEEEGASSHRRGVGKRAKLAPGAPAAPGPSPATADDPFLLSAAMWSADGRAMLPHGGRGPPSSSAPASCRSAFSPLATPVPRRSAAVRESRAGLPVVRSEAEVMEALAEHDIVVLAGETGSGKTTQVPQFLWEAGYGTPYAALQPRPWGPGAQGCDATRPHALFRGFPGMIGVTQPRRVAATAMAARVAEELGEGGGGAGSRGGSASTVGYQVRFDSGTVGPRTRLKFMTDGILLREAASDLLLRSYSVIVIDEAHERGVNTDVLLGLLSRALPLRNAMAAQQAEQACAELAARRAAADEGAAPGSGFLDYPDPRGLLGPLKLIIMSATLRVEDFTANPRLFPAAPPPLLRVEARQFPVSVHFSRVTELDDYLGAAYKKVVGIHSRLPDGGVLVFVTGAGEVEELCARLRERFQKKREQPPPRPQGALEGAVATASGAAEADVAEGNFPTAAPSSGAAAAGSVSPAAADGASSPAPGDAAATVVEGGEVKQAAGDCAPVCVLPLYALLSPAQQQRVFQPPPPGARLIVVATNVAETSLTIPGIRYVVDTGRVKRRVFSLRSGSSRFEVGWVSRAAADQRAGRAGRTGPGHAYRLYSSALFSNDAAFPAFELPAVASVPAPALVLALKALGIASVAAFPFPSPPPPASLSAAIRSLERLGALVPVRRQQQQPAAAAAAGGVIGADADAAAALAEIESEELTPLGAACARLPLAPQLAKILVLAASASPPTSSLPPGPGDRPPTLLDYAIALVAALSVSEPFVRPHLAPGPKRPQGAAKRQGPGPPGGEAEAPAAGEEGEDEEGGGGGGDAGAGGTARDRRLLAALLREEDPGEGGSGDPGDKEAAAEAARTLARNSAAAAHAQFRHPLSDGLTVLRACGAWAHTLHANGPAAAAAFCRAGFLRGKALSEWAAMRRQLHGMVHGMLGQGEGEGGEEGGWSSQPGRVLASDDEGEDEEGEGGKQRRRGRGAGLRPQGPAFLPALPPLPAATDTLLRQLVAAGQLENVARRASPEEASRLCVAAGLPASGKTRSGVHWVPYLPAAGYLSAPLFLHPSTALSPGRGAGPESLPQWLVFSELIAPDPAAAADDTDPAAAAAAAPSAAASLGARPPSTRSYMRGCTAIEPGWLPSLAAQTPLVRFEAPLETPPPFFDAARDALMCHAVPVFGDRAWRLAPALRPLPPSPAGRRFDALSDARLRTFARGLLEGAVVPALAGWADSLVQPPGVLLKPTAAGQRRVADLLQALAAPPGGGAPVDSAARLGAVWRAYPAFLLAEYRPWMQERWRASVEKLWPTLVHKALAHWEAAAVAGHQ